jgi:nitrite reductase/ring-hydroxylating ferredoxin subunit
MTERMSNVEIAVGSLAELEDPGCREFTIGEGDWPFNGFVVRHGDDVFAYQNVCAHAGHPLNWSPDRFLTRDRSAIICSSHGATYDIKTGKCIAGPANGRSLRTVEVLVRDGVVYVQGPDRTL